MGNEFQKVPSILAVFLDSKPTSIYEAILTVKLKGVGIAQHNDKIGILGLPLFPTPNVAQGDIKTFKINLLDYYSSEELLNQLLVSSPKGIIFFRYADDGQIKSAELSISYQ